MRQGNMDRVYTEHDTPDGSSVHPAKQQVEGMGLILRKICRLRSRLDPRSIKHLLKVWYLATQKLLVYYERLHALISANIQCDHFCTQAGDQSAADLKQ